VAAVETSVIEPEALDVLLDSLRARGFRVLGPTVREGAIVYDDLGSAAELPIGWTDSQDGGLYRLERRDDEARFGYAVGPHSDERSRTGRVRQERPSVRLRAGATLTAWC
jgi:sulfhydrogenase subunit beta (sulfur reductase)